IPAVVEAWSPGERGGNAVADILFGDYNPSGRLPITIPRHVGQLPVYYNSRPSKSYWIKEGWGKKYVDLSPKPLYDFGHGLSYTTFVYRNLTITPKVAGAAGLVEVALEVANTGGRDGEETVQLYINDVVASVSRPIQELRGFQRVPLKRGESQT